MSENQILIKRGLRVGDLEAETDKELLSKCFVDNGDVDLLIDVKRPESIIVGRTGSGKSALILRINEVVEKSVVLDPNHISIRFLEHSDVIQFFEGLNVNLDLFYRYLWRHILTVELLKLRYSLKSESDSNNLWDKLFSLVGRDTTKKEGLAYFKEWGDKFWLETDQQLREVTEKLSRELKSGFGTELNDVRISLNGAKSLSEERKSEIVNRAKRVVSNIQIKKMTDVLDLLETKVFDDKQKKFYILIDKLDEDWAETKTRYRFIRALIEEIKTFRRICNVKIIISMRRDLLDMVFDHTRETGFQQEKYESYMLPLSWSRDALANLLELRINEVFKRQYTRAGISFSDIFPVKMKHENITALDYMLDRTLFRPRDAMQFVNECFVSAFNESKVSWRSINAAESTYSEKRLKSLFEEWSDVYPRLEESLELLRNMNVIFYRSDIAEKINKISEEMNEQEKDPCWSAIIKFCEGGNAMSESDVVAEFINCFFRVGAIGVKVSKNEPYMWADYDNAILTKSNVKRINQIKIHKMLHKTLSIRDLEIDGFN